MPGSLIPQGWTKPFSFLRHRDRQFPLVIWKKRHQGCRTWAGLAVPAAVETPAHAATETAAKTRMHKAGASEPRMEKARVTKAEASEVRTEKAAAEPAVP